MDAYCAEVQKLEKHFQGLEILHVLRDSNVAADTLAKLGSNRAKGPTQCICGGAISPLHKTTQ
jgi:hypothetical protein